MQTTSLPPPRPPDPASIAATVAAMLAWHGITHIYTAAYQVIAVLSVSPGLTAWTNGRLLWITRDGQRETWPAADTQGAAARLAALARPDAPDLRFPVHHLPQEPGGTGQPGPAGWVTDPAVLRRVRDALASGGQPRAARPAGRP